jgi:hypothetical protein
LANASSRPKDALASQGLGLKCRKIGLFGSQSRVEAAIDLLALEYFIMDVTR